MKIFGKKFATAALIAAVAVMAVGCGGGDKKEAAKPKNELLKVGCTNFANSLDPVENYFGWEVMRRAIGECLTKFDEKMVTRPWLAESWKVADDKLSWTFTVKNVKFQNGKAVTGEAVKKSLDRVFAKSPRARALFTPTKITAEGQNVTIYTDVPVATMPGILGDPLFIIIDTDEEGKRDFATQGPIATGPYMVTSYSKQKTEMVASEHYWDGKVPYKKVDFLTIDDPNTRAMALQKGEIDVAVNIASGDMDLFKDPKKFTISTIESIRDVLARINQAPGRPLADVKVRQALIRCLNREEYCKTLLKGTFTPGGPMFPPSLDFDFANTKDPNAYDVESAKKLLAEAGYKDTDGDGFVDKDGKNLELDFVFYSGRAELPLFAEATQADAKQIGIKVNLKNVDYNILYDIGCNGTYDLLISNILTLQGGDPEVFLNMYWHSNDGGKFPENGSGYSSKEFDDLSAELAKEFDAGKRRDIAIKMGRILLDDSATFVFGYPQTNMVSNVKVKNANIQPCDYYWLTKDFTPAE